MAAMVIMNIKILFLGLNVQQNIEKESLLVRQQTHADTRLQEGLPSKYLTNYIPHIHDKNV